MSLSKHLSTTAGYATFFELLVTDGGSNKDFVEETGLGYNTIRKLVMVMHRRKLIYISHWDKDTNGRYVVPVYSLGNKQDKKRPPPLTWKERKERQIKKQEFCLLSSKVKYNGIYTNPLSTLA